MTSKPFSPFDYISQSCQLHLECDITTLKSDSKAALDLFLAIPTQQEDDNNNNDNDSNNDNNESNENNGNRITPRLFIWIQDNNNETTNNETKTTEYEIMASTETFNSQNNRGVLAFINTSTTQPITKRSQIQCMTLAPFQPALVTSSTENDLDSSNDANVNEEDTNTNNKNNNNELSMNSFHTLQLYTQHAFVPTIQSLSLSTTKPSSTTSTSNTTTTTKESTILQSLESKIRELNITLAQCRRSTLVSSIPHITLTTHAFLEQKAQELPSSGKIDLDSLQLSSSEGNDNQSLLTNDEFLNEIQSIVNSWIPQIQKVTFLPSSQPPPTSDYEEITYWSNLSHALSHIQSELSKPSTILTLNILKSSKRFVSILALENNTHLKKAQEQVDDIYTFLKHYPAEKLGSCVAGSSGSSSSSSMDNLYAVLQEIFENCVGRIRSSRYYTLDRLIALIESSLNTTKERMEYILKETYKENGILWIPYEQYIQKVYNPTSDLFVQLDHVWIKNFKEFVLELGRKRQIRNIGLLVKEMNLGHGVLKERLDVIYRFRCEHEKLYNVVHEVLMGEEEGTIDGGSSTTAGGDGIAINNSSSSSSSTLKEVEDAPMTCMGKIDVFDLSEGGRVAFTSALEKYERKIDAIEERLAKLLRDKLTACQDAEDMFAVFARFNPLITRTRVHNAVKEFQIQLISTVGMAIKKLQTKFTLKYETSAAKQFSQLRGIPPIAGKILWAKQIERQVNALMKRMGDVLGPNWGQHLEGRQLRRSGDELLSKLDAKAFFRAWVTEWEKDMSAEATASNARLSSYPIVIVREGVNNSLIAKVNFNEKYEQLFREIRYLKWLGFERDIPKTLSLSSEENLARYPHAMALKAALRSYTVTRDLVDVDLQELVLPQLKGIREAIAEAFGVSSEGSTTKSSSSRRVRWDGKEMTEWVAGLTELVTRFEERVETLLYSCDKIYTQLDELSNVKYDHQEFLSIAESIQKIIDELSLKGYAGLNSWVSSVDEKMSAVLCSRLEDAIQGWTEYFQVKPGVLRGHLNDDEDDGESSEPKIENLPEIDFPQISLEILLRNQQISTNPNLPVVRSVFLRKFHEYVAVICALPRPTSGRFEVFEPHEGKEETTKTFDNLLQLVSPECLSEAYLCIESHMEKVSEFVTQWLSYQELWDTRVIDVATAVGEDMNLWHDLLEEATDARSSLDLSTTVTKIGPVFIKYDKVHSQVNLKYDAWQKELQSCYAEILGQKIIEFHGEVSNAKSRLETVTLDGTTATYDLVLNVTFVQEMRENLPSWGQNVSNLIDAERLLRRQRHIFHKDWFEGSRLQGQFEHLEYILSKRCRTMEEQMPILQTRVIAEDKVAEQRVLDLLTKWGEEKPLRGNIHPEKANEILSKYETDLKKAKTDDESLIKAKDALGLDTKVSNGEIITTLDELLDLKEVWNAISAPFESLQKIKSQQWSTAAPRQIRKQLEDITAEMRSLSNKVRQFDAYVSLNDTIKSYLSGHAVLSDLKTEALKDRHWKTILKRLGLDIQLSQLTIGLLWEKGITRRRKEIGEILTVAQGEMALEQFLGQVRDRWMKQELELVLYQSRVRLIKGWDNLFTVLDDHLGGLVLMKSSPYYRAVREFQEEGKLWEDRLTKLRGAFDSWVEVQRRWVYLEGIFYGSADIKAQLPTEWSRFRNIDGEFITLMRRVSGRPYAMEVLNIDNLQRTLERLESLMVVIQRALGDYLARQRSEFSRFYFLGDEDLLEIIGNSDEPGKVIPHVGKMFAGITSLKASSRTLENGIVALFEAMISKDGEEVPLNSVIEVASKKPVKEWLKKLENLMHNTLASLLLDAVKEDSSSTLESENEHATFIEWAKRFPAQVMILATLINWSMGIDDALSNEGHTRELLTTVLSNIERKLEIMAQTVLLDLPSESRKKFEQLITELVHQRDVTQSLLDNNVADPYDFRWLYHLRFQYNPDAEIMTEKLQISLSNAHFFYGFEYLGIGDRLVQTPLTDRAYLTLTQALHFRMGGNPFGPAGTGKTETVKALGAQLGRFVVVMNCDESFDFGAMGRIFCGLCQVGAWGCFDEFNRLEERILSAVSQQILTIQRGLLERQHSIELLGQSIRLHENVGIFVTMNPGYAGRSNLPDNLKTLFRAVAMVKPDSKMIAQVMLYSQGIVSAKTLSHKVVQLFQLCEARMSTQSHYDFSLRALKTLLISAGASKRKMQETLASNDDILLTETAVLVETTCNNVLPKLVADDVGVFGGVLREVFPGASVCQMNDEKLRNEVTSICESRNYLAGEHWLQKILQLRQVLEMRHGVMLVGPSGVGKSSAIEVLLKSLEKIDGKKGEMYIIDPKAIDKACLYGVLDGTTMEWTDGVFTSILRKILMNQKGESEKRHWIVFDGDVDPVWAENLNSVLDDNKLLTLPSGERLNIPDNIRIILEVDSLKQATAATVSRCGMVWFSEDTVSTEMSLSNLFNSLRNEDLVGDGNSIPSAQTSFLDSIKQMIVGNDDASLVSNALEFALMQTHIMEPTRERLLASLKALLIQGILKVIEYDENHIDFPMCGEHLENFSKRWTLHSLLWSFGGSTSWVIRQKLSDLLVRSTGSMLPQPQNSSIADYRVRVEDGEYELWSSSVPRMEIESHKVVSSDVVVTTTDTIRHSEVLHAWLSSRMPLILCGPPGSGKTMTLTSVLQSIQGIVMANLNFSSKTTPEIILKTFSQYCVYTRKGKDLVLQPSESLGSHTWLVVFCDEINLPENDSYGTQRVITFIRQLVERGGFWRDDNQWIKINRIQFVGACNPPTDAGRVVMSSRFLRHAPLILVDFPARDSLHQIYSTFNGGIMKLFPNLKGETNALTEAMVDFYFQAQSKFTPDMQPQYFYSPRELSRWVRGIYESVVEMESLTREELVRIWAHEALRLFCDRLVEESEREWCEELVDSVARSYFAGIDHSNVLARPLFYSTWLSKETKSVGRDELRDFLGARLRVFYEEELDVPLVIFDEVLDHILRIDRVLRQPMGHCLLIGDSGSGKTVLSKFVAWMNGLNIFQIKAHSKYTLENFNEDLRHVMRRVGVDGEKVCFIFDESNALGSGFLEAMNALLASGEVPGLFEGDDYTALMNSFRDASNRSGVIADSEEELWRRFINIVQRNLHVVFTMNPSGGEWKNRATTSPALFNRTVVNWVGTWSAKAMAEVGKEFTMRLDMGDSEHVGSSWGIGDGESIMNVVSEAFSGTGGLRQAVVAALVEMHKITKEMAEECASSSSSACRTYLSPRDYLALIHNFVSCVNKQREKVEDEQLHVNAGMSKLKQTQENVAELKVALNSKKTVLREKENLANKKLQQMVGDQKEAEVRKAEAEKTSVEVKAQESEISQRKEYAQRELDAAEPALRDAQAAVKSIHKPHLDEVRKLLKPPNNVQLTLECVALMMGETNLEWSNVKKVVGARDFIQNILNFAADKLTPRQVQVLHTKYLDGNKDLNYESVMRSSRACGPLYKWAESQVKYSTVFNKIQPLRDEVQRLEEDAASANERKVTLDKEVQGLEASISQYKTDYASLIRDVESLKAEMDVVTKKVDRAESLIKSLSKESERWSKSSSGFEHILQNLVGDGLLMAAFLTYTGFFDFKARRTLMKRWRKSLDLLGIDFRAHLSMTEVLSDASDRLKWQAYGLPTDSLSIENGVILDHCVRFPLIIDPSGQAINFIMKKHSDQKIQRTSFLDNSFMKTLAGAIRFGTTLLVENVEVIDPVLNPILNKEIQRTGGRSLVRIGTEEVDYSPKFKIILTTKNPAAKLTPDLCSRVTLINFTVTPASLQSQSLSLILKIEKPEIEEKRINLLKLQGEQQVKLRTLENQMLSKISAVEGSILDDDRVVDGMEQLMVEGAEIENQIANSDNVMKQVQVAIGKFEPLADLCKSLFILLTNMRELSFLYEFSAKSFMKVLQKTLQTPRVDGSSEVERLGALKDNLFREIAGNFARSLSAEDKMVFALFLSKLKGSEHSFDSDSITREVITDAIENDLGPEFPWQGIGLNNLAEVASELDALSPMMLCSAPGHDVSGRIDALSRTLGKDLSSVAMGSAEGYATAERMVNTASKLGTWVILRNVHLCTEWLQQHLVKKLQSLNQATHPDFRLFITSEMNPKLPTALLRLSDVIVAEAPGGVKASLSRFYSNINAERASNSVKNRLYLILGWVHSVVQERLRYIPAGWSQAYGFTEADAIHALDVIDSLIDETMGEKKTVIIDPEKLPWDAIRTTLCKGVFGGRITKDSDQVTLDALVSRLFVPECFNINFKLVETEDDSSPLLPDDTSYESCLDWIHSLDSNTPPTWIGLDGSAEMIRSQLIGKSVISKVEQIENSLKNE